MFIRLTLRNFETDEWRASHVRSTDIQRVAAASEETRSRFEGAGSELCASGGALLAQEPPEVVLDRIAAAERARGGPL